MPAELTASEITLGRRLSLLETAVEDLQESEEARARHDETMRSEIRALAESVAALGRQVNEIFGAMSRIVSHHSACGLIVGKLERIAVEASQDAKRRKRRRPVKR